MITCTPDIRAKYDLPNTWFTRREMTKGRLVQSRPDFWLVSNHQDIKPGIHSDHSILATTFMINNTQEKHRSFFTFNSSLLRDECYVENITNIISDISSKQIESYDKALNWDTLKYIVRGATISYASRKAQERREFENNLTNRLKFLESNLTDETLSEYKAIKNTETCRRI